MHVDASHQTQWRLPQHTFNYHTRAYRLECIHRARAGALQTASAWPGQGDPQQKFTCAQRELYPLVRVSVISRATFTKLISARKFSAAKTSAVASWRTASNTT